MSVGTPKENNVKRIGKLYIVDVVAQALNEPRIFRSLDWTANILSVCSRVRHSYSLSGGGRHALQFAGCSFYCIDNVLIARAAAEIAFESFPYLFLAGITIGFEKRIRGHDHSRCAEAALKTMLFPETLLHGIELAILCQAFDLSLIHI